jgi:hypothetical protein
MQGRRRQIECRLEARGDWDFCFRVLDGAFSGEFIIEYMAQCTFQLEATR